MVDKDSFDGQARHQEPAQYNVYTDGSLMDGRVGAGFSINLGDKVVLAHSYHLSEGSSVFQAEIFAINEAATALQYMYDANHVKFYVDSQAALGALAAPAIKSKLVLKTMRSLNDIPAQVKMVWVKAHQGNPGNEHADQLAKEGGHIELINHVGLPRAQIKMAIHNGIREKWDQWWLRYPHARQTKFFYPGQNKKFGKEVMGFTRFQLARYIRIVTGHNNLLYHRSNINPDIDQRCRFCEEQKETFIHFFTDCPALWKTREEAEHAQPGGHLEFVSPTQILNFSFQPRINAALENQDEVDAAWRAMEVISDTDSESGADSVTSGADANEMEQHAGSEDDADSRMDTD